jgi:hypothetical protein
LPVITIYSGFRVSSNVVINAMASLYFLLLFCIITSESVKISELEKKYIQNIIKRTGNGNDENSNPVTVILPPLPCSRPTQMPAYQ